MTLAAGWAHLAVVLVLVYLMRRQDRPYVMTVHGVSYRVTDDGLEKRSPWSKNFTARWPDVTRVSYNQTLNQFVVDTTAGPARVGGFLNGLGDLRAALERHVPPVCMVRSEPAPRPCHSVRTGVYRMMIV